MMECNCQLVELTGMEEVFIHELISIKNIIDSKKSIRDLVSSLYDIKSQLVIPKELHGIPSTNWDKFESVMISIAGK